MGGMPGGMPGMPGSPPVAPSGLATGSGVESGRPAEDRYLYDGDPGMGMGMGGGMPGGSRGRGRRGGFTQRTLRPAKPLEAVRVVLVTDQGQMDSGSYVVSKQEKQGDWAQVKIPMSKFKGPGAKSGAKLIGVIFTGDSIGKLLIGRAELQGA